MCTSSTLGQRIRIVYTSAPYEALANVNGDETLKHKVLVSELNSVGTISPEESMRENECGDAGKEREGMETRKEGKSLKLVNTYSPRSLSKSLHKTVCIRRRRCGAILPATHHPGRRYHDVNIVTLGCWWPAFLVGASGRQAGRQEG